MQTKKSNIRQARPGEAARVAQLIMDAMTKLYDRIADKNLLIRRITVTANKVVDERDAQKYGSYEQLELFAKEDNGPDEAELERERKMQNAMLDIKKKFGKNAVIKGMNLCEGATAIDRNKQIGGHKA